MLRRNFLKSVIGCLFLPFVAKKKKKEVTGGLSFPKAKPIKGKIHPLFCEHEYAINICYKLKFADEFLKHAKPFELRCPSAFGSYRNIPKGENLGGLTRKVWCIVSELAEECALYVPKQNLGYVELSFFKYGNKAILQWVYRPHMMSPFRNKYLRKK